MLIEESTQNQFSASTVQRLVDDLPAGDVLVQVEYSSLNYKDALSANGNRGVTKSYPHTPGIDAAGKVIESNTSRFAPGDEVIVCGYDLGMNTSGGFGQLIRVPSTWVVNCPREISLRESMMLGTAGFTAALCVEKLISNSVLPEAGEVLVTGATGGVGAVAVALLHQLGYSVVASTGKQDQHDFLKGLGAARIIDRQILSDNSRKPLLKEQWVGAIDVVGGTTLSNIIKSLKYGGSVACCGLVGSTALDATVLPFILRGVNLLGVDSVELPLATKERIWTLLAREWKLDNLGEINTEIGFDSLITNLGDVLAGKAVGRMLLNLNS
ncbi:MAG: YhdH/YhfP family quinone oxidoreductase [Gammaproteobacteria bacterium]|nr:YhdH/YhfP family quinone oxidoreductase [Gammaproteobacteria bacterium]